METPSSVLAWRIPRTREPGGLPSMASQSWRRLKRLSSSSVFSSTIRKHSLALSLLYGPTRTSVHDYWKNHSCDYADLCLCFLIRGPVLSWRRGSFILRRQSSDLRTADGARPLSGKRKRLRAQAGGGALRPRDNCAGAERKILSEEPARW